MKIATGPGHRRVFRAALVLLAVSSSACGSVVDVTSGAGGTGNGGGNGGGSGATGNGGGSGATGNGGGSGATGNGGGDGGGEPCAPVDDGNPCTVDLCEGNVPVNDDSPPGSPCSADGGVCDGIGNCVDSCLDPADCSIPLPDCHVHTCDGGICGVAFVAADEAIAAPIPGNCAQEVCDGAGNVVLLPDDSDLPMEDGDHCTDEVCDGGIASHPERVCNDGDACTVGETCQVGACNDGTAVACNNGEACVSGTCVDATCMIRLPRLPVATLPGSYYSVLYHTVEMVDLNGDGALDLVAAEGDVFVLFGKGDGTFSSPVTHSMGGAAGWVITADLNGDDAPDLVVSIGVGLRVLENHGDGTFAPAMDYPSKYGARPQATDLNGDGALDLVAIYPAIGDGSGATGMDVFSNHGDGTFAPKVGYSTPDVANSLHVADLDGNTSPDLVLEIGDGFSATSSVRLNQGDGTFAPEISYPATGRIDRVADLNGDGRPDILARYGPEAKIRLNNGDGTFAPVAYYPIGSGCNQMKAIDVDDDGSLDVVVAGEDGVGVLLNQGDGTFAPRIDHPMSSESNNIAAADLNGDGKVDLAVANYGTKSCSIDEACAQSPTMGVLFNNGDGTFGPRVDYPGPSSFFTVHLVDLDGDTLPDLAAREATGVHVLLNEGNGTFDARAVYPTEESPQAVAVADLDQDGHADLAVTSYTFLQEGPVGPNTVSVLLNAGDGTFGPRTVYPTGVTPRAIVVADLNGDNHGDLATANEYGDSVSVLLNQGDGTFAVTATFPAGTSPRAIAAADLDGDSRPDLVVVNRPNWEPSTISILWNQNGQGFSLPVSEVMSDWFSSVAVADLNGDAMPDLAGLGDGLDVLLNLGNGTFAPPVHYATGDGKALVAADLDGDGLPDLAVTCSEPCDTTKILRNNGDGSFGPATTYPEGGWSITSVDLNGDGKLDLAVADRHARIFLNSGNGSFTAAGSYGAGLADEIASGDLNGDGHGDLAVPSHGTVSVLLTSCMPF